jgi:hypothetical protein
MVVAARKRNPDVRLGTQPRFMPGVIEGIAKMRDGVIGFGRFSRGGYPITRATNSGKALGAGPRVS